MKRNTTQRSVTGRFANDTTPAFGWKEVLTELLYTPSDYTGLRDAT